MWRCSEPPQEEEQLEMYVLVAVAGARMLAVAGVEIVSATAQAVGVVELNVVVQWWALTYGRHHSLGRRRRRDCSCSAGGCVRAESAGVVLWFAVVGGSGNGASSACPEPAAQEENRFEIKKNGMHSY